MRVTIDLDDELIADASKLTGIKENDALVKMGLRSLIERESARQLAKMGGTQPNLKPIPRRRSRKSA